MIYFIVEQKESNTEFTDKLSNFFSSFVNFTVNEGITVINTTDFDLSLLTTGYFPTEYHNGVVKSTVEHALIGEDRFLYAEALAFIKKMKESLKDFAEKPKEIDINHALLCEVLENVVLLNTSCSTIEEVLENASKETGLKEHYPNIVIHLGSEQTKFEDTKLTHLVFNDSELTNKVTIEKKLKTLFNTTKLK